jgi:hypothetical protein
MQIVGCSSQLPAVKEGGKTPRTTRFYGAHADMPTQLYPHKFYGALRRGKQKLLSVQCSTSVFCWAFFADVESGLHFWTACCEKSKATLSVLIQSFWRLHFKNAGHCPLKTTCSLKNCKKNCSNWVVNSDPQLLWNCLFGGNLGNVEILEFNSSSNWWLSVLLAHGDIGNCWICKSKFLF